ncbi:MAG: helix-turn-helix transcriptional regulator [Sedimentibacter sp.]
MIERILELLKINCIPAKKLTDELGLSNSAVTDWKKGRAKPSTDAVIKIANYFNVSTDYILTGKDYSNTSTSKLFKSNVDKNEKILLSNFRKLDNMNKRLLLALLEILMENISSSDDLEITHSDLTKNPLDRRRQIS